ncbi:MAG: ImmA/IrrE family metallo-endopeptidase [Candidatus Aenigmarchaeota archaeon]|nr:ImmA/IrrE family metallo-endopeptidase [Candidatus Aenigmarchaeota archaeon]
MKRSEYYEELKELARNIRAEYKLTTPKVLLSDLRRIYKAYGIRVDLWPHKLKNLRGAYFGDDLGPTVMLAKRLPKEPRIFTMAHELKHHLVDRDKGYSYCDPSNQSEPIEIGAEVFAAELIFPDSDFIEVMGETSVGLNECKPETIVHLKHKTGTTMSYAGLVKKAEFLGYAVPGILQGIKYKKLEEELFGEPLYKKLARYRRKF